MRKPVIQELREIITPYRRVVQEILPVQEEIQTIIAKGEPRQQAGAADIGGGNGASAGGNLGGGNGFASSGAGFASSGAGRSSGGAGGYGGGLKAGGSYASAASNQASITSSPKSSKSSSSAGSAISYLDASSGHGIQFASSAVSSPSSSGSSSGKSASYNNESPIRIVEGGNSRSSGLSNINAYARRARARA